ncbi:MAG TPA: hypothetical protein VD763_09955 [Candidatus Saccharimonadales bacterium]|nr:hypothetical protein [Candidatus Saccharimonadales bacterium]
MARPPLGALILGFFAVFAGIVDILQGLRFMGIVVFGPTDLGDGLFLYGLIAVVIGVLWVAAGYAFWSLQAVAWLLGMLLSALGLLNAIVVLFTTGNLAWGAAVALIPLVVLWYLQQDDIKRAFSVDMTP